MSSDASPSVLPVTEAVSSKTKKQMAVRERKVDEIRESTTSMKSEVATPAKTPEQAPQPTRQTKQVYM